MVNNMQSISEDMGFVEWGVVLDGGKGILGRVKRRDLSDKCGFGWRD